MNVTHPSAKQWEGWGSALKPAVEPIVLARKPLDGTLAANTLAYGVGGINIDACRVPVADESDKASAFPGGKLTTNGVGHLAGPGSAHDVSRGEFAAERNQIGRWPPNLLHDGSPEVLNCFPASAGQLARARTDNAAQGNNVYGALKHVTHAPEARGDSGSAARFFPSFPFTDDERRLLYQAKANAADRAGSKHPTVKPVALMQWLCRLVTPPGGLILDPFAGSGSTGAAAIAEGFDCVLIEQNADYVADIRKRLDAVASFR